MDDGGSMETGRAGSAAGDDCECGRFAATVPGYSDDVSIRVRSSVSSGGRSAARGTFTVQRYSMAATATAYVTTGVRDCVAYF